MASQIIMEQYAYDVYANYDILIKVNRIDKSNINLDYYKKRILVFLDNSDGSYLDVKELFTGCSLIHIIIFEYKNVTSVIPLVFSATRGLLLEYIEYLKYDFPQVISSDSDKEFLIELGGSSLYNIYYLMRICYYNQITVRQIESRDILTQVDNKIKDKDLICVLSMLAVGIHKKLALLILKEDKLNYYLSKQYIFSNAEYILPNVSIHLYYKRNYTLNLSIWDALGFYIENILDDSDCTIIDQVSWVLQKTIEIEKNNFENLKEQIFKIEEKLHQLFRFLYNDKLLILENLCKQFFENDQKLYSYILVNEAILYEDIENFNVAKEKFLKVLELCESPTEIQVKVFVFDEFSRLLEKTGFHFEALEKLYFVEKFYKDSHDIKKLQNVQNRIGLNLCFIGNIRKAASYLESLHFNDFAGEVYEDNVLSCEVANNLSICYMEMGDFKEALNLQDKLYRMYLVIENAPINYATDILQNKGNVYLFQHKYKDAMLCFEQALQDEKNPVSKELILENYLYAKAFNDKNVHESVYFFENTVEQGTNYESCKMLAELYFEGKIYDKCSFLCKKMLSKIIYVQNQILYFSFDILWVKSMIMLNQFSLNQKLMAWLRLIKYQKFILKNIGKTSPYYRELEICKKVILGTL